MMLSKLSNLPFLKNRKYEFLTKKYYCAYIIYVMGAKLVKVVSEP